MGTPTIMVVVPIAHSTRSPYLLVAFETTGMLSHLNMRRVLLLVGMIVIAMAMTASASAALDEMQLEEPQMRDVEYVDSMAQAIGLVEVRNTK